MMVTRITLLSGLILTSCNETDGVFLIDDGTRPNLENEVLNEYPAILDSLIEQHLKYQISDSFSIEYTIVCHPAVLQTEPSKKEYIDRKTFIVQVGTKTVNSNKISNWMLDYYKNSTSDFACVSFRKIPALGR